MRSLLERTPSSLTIIRVTRHPFLQACVTIEHHDHQAFSGVVRPSVSASCDRLCFQVRVAALLLV